MTTTECISLHLGQAGIRLASTVWDFLCEEEGITVDGTINDAMVRSDRQCMVGKFFNADSKGKHIPRALLVDFVVDSCRSQACWFRANCLGRTLFSGEQFMYYNKGTKQNFAEGRYSMSKRNIDVVMDNMRRQAEQCGNLQDIIIYHSMGGGTGSGFTALILEQLSEDYGKTGKIQFAISGSSEYDEEPAETYNHVLHTAATAYLSDIVVMFDNYRLVARCRHGLGVEQPEFETLNQIVANVISSTTLPMRTGNGKYGTKRFAADLVPHPGMRFPIASFAPVKSKESINHENHTDEWRNEKQAQHYIDNLTQGCFQPYQSMVFADVREGKSMAIAMVYRGEVNDEEYIPIPINLISKDPTLQTVSWREHQYQYDNVSSRPPTLEASRVKGKHAQAHMVPRKRAVCVLNNNTAMVNRWGDYMANYEYLMKDKQLYHLYTAEGMEEGEFEIAREHVKSLIEDYGAINF